jgi:hypothetical protein
MADDDDSPGRSGRHHTLEETQGACHGHASSVTAAKRAQPRLLSQPPQNPEEATLISADFVGMSGPRSPPDATAGRVPSDRENRLRLAGAGAAAAGSGQVAVGAVDAQHAGRRARRFRAQVIDADTRWLRDGTRYRANRSARYRIRDCQAFATTAHRRPEYAVDVSGAVTEGRSTIDASVGARALVRDRDPGAAGLARVSVGLPIDAADRSVDRRADAMARSACTPGAGGSSRAAGSAASAFATGAAHAARAACASSTGAAGSAFATGTAHARATAPASFPACASRADGAPHSGRAAAGPSHPTAHPGCVAAAPSGCATRASGPITLAALAWCARAVPRGVVTGAAPAAPHTAVARSLGRYRATSVDETHG